MNEQANFFERIKQTLPSYQNLAQSVADILGISINEAYKKIRGTSLLNINQITKLSDGFSIPFQYQPSQLPTVTFNYVSHSDQAEHMTEYLKEMLATMKQIQKSKQKHITVTSDDVPIFHFFKYPTLTAFKLFYWANNPSMQQFDFEKLPSSILHIALELHQVYLEIPSTEIWAKDTIHGTIEQIRYSFEAGHIGNKADAVAIVEQLRYCLTDISMYAIGSKKTIDNTHSFNWYHCDVLGGITYLVDLEQSMLCYNRFNTYNYLKTEDQTFCLQTKEWIKGLINKSMAFSGQGEKHRNKYLYQAFAECDKLIDEINKA